MKQNIDTDFEQQIEDYLIQHSDFFSRHERLLDELHIPHETGSAVSLLEHKIRRLEMRARDSQAQLNKLLEIARNNEKLHQRLHQLTLKLIEASDQDEVEQILEDELRQRFNADAVSLKLFTHDQLEEAHISQSGMAVFHSFMDNDQPTCGALKADKLKILFGEEAGEQGSAALIPIRTHQLAGILAIGSKDQERFHPGKGMDFLTRLGELVSLSIQAAH